LLNAYGITNASEMNWNVFPLFVVELEYE